MTGLATRPRDTSPRPPTPRPPRDPSGSGRRPGPRRAGTRALALLGAVVLAVVAVVGSGSEPRAELGAEGLEPVAARADVAAGHGDPRAATVALGDGETAWEALRPHVPEGTAHEVFVHEVLQANDVDARELRPGDVVVVPGAPR